MSIKVIAFGSIGTIIETSEIQRKAFNAAFTLHGLDWNWSRDEYRKMLKSSGGERRIADYAKQMGVKVDASDIHQSKTKIFDDHIKSHGADVRDGVMDVISFANKNGLKLALVSSTSEDNIEALFKATSTAVSRSNFALVTDASMVSKSKPAPDIYQVAMHELDVAPEEIMAIEDSEASLKSALAAGIKCIAFPGENTQDQNYVRAVVTVNRLTADLFDASSEAPAYMEAHI